MELALEGWLADKFMPLGFEVGGAWGPAADYAFASMLEVKAAGASVDLELTYISV